uniref:FimB/Mfa2 family fimbrial subunit n=1 Tax=Bacteroides nordii TaxID=291645 RepID=UPI002A7F9DFC|nr:FimB/Mfa2 family fimbrial subunit [Bacteroides nordii]
MRYSKLTYCLLAFLCLATTSCIQNELIEEYPIEQENPVQVHLTLNMPQATSTDIQAGTAGEQYINDVHVYVFSQNGSFIEKASKVYISGTDGDATRTIIGVLESDYQDQTNIEIIVLTNLTARNITVPTSVVNKNTLYDQLRYTYTPGQDWIFPTQSNKKYIPMWGTCSLAAIREKDINQANLSLIRAIAKVDVTLNGGTGFDHFKLNTVKVCSYNTQGYCIPVNDETMAIPSIPENVLTKKNITFTATTGEQKAGIQNKIYIPEYKNKGVSDNQVSYLEITGELTTSLSETIQKTYRIDFKVNGKGDTFDILRNNWYKFNITSISQDVDVETQCSYEVERWDYINVDVPPFN